MSRLGVLAWGRAGLSVLAVLQIGVVVLVPNGENYIGSKVGPWITPYVSFLELTNHWSFFAPEPAPPVFIEYSLLDSRGDEIGRGRFPDMEKQPFLRERLNRRIAATEFIVADDARTERVMLPYLCNQFPEAQSVRLWRLYYTIPSISDVADGKRKIGDDVNMDRREVSTSYCEGRA
jgi:hypothetical protein